MAPTYEPLPQGEKARPGEDIQDKREEAQTAQDAEEVANAQEAPTLFLRAPTSQPHWPCHISWCQWDSSPEAPMGVTSPPGLQLPLWDEQAERARVFYVRFPSIWIVIPSPNASSQSTILELTWPRAAGQPTVPATGKTGCVGGF